MFIKNIIIFGLFSLNLFSDRLPFIPFKILTKAINIDVMYIKETQYGTLLYLDWSSKNHPDFFEAIRHASDWFLKPKNKQWKDAIKLYLKKGIKYSPEKIFEQSSKLEIFFDNALLLKKIKQR